MGTENTNFIVHIDLRGVSEVGKALIDHVAKFIGGVVEPVQMKRIAAAQADVALVKAMSDITVQGLHERATLRAFQEGVRHQHNMEFIAFEAAKSSHSENKEKPDHDWLDHFFQHARHISSSHAQGLWGKILANEFHQPGQASKKLLDILRSLDAQDAQLFQKLCEFSVVKDDEPTPIFPSKADFIQESGLTVNRIKDLEAVGLVNLLTFRLGGAKLPESGVYHFKVGSFIIEAHAPALPKPKSGIDLGMTSFTKYGRELFRIVNIEPSTEFKKWFKRHILSSGYATSEPLESHWPDA